MEQHKFAKVELLKKYLDNTITDAEAQELFAWLKDMDFENNKEVEEIMAAYFQTSLAETAKLPGQTRRESLDKLLNKINEVKEKNITPVRRLNKQWWMAAASVAILLCTGSYFFFFNKNQAPIEIVATTSKDIAPPKANKAIITLSNGQALPIDSLNNGQLAMQGNVRLIKNSNGDIIYTGTADSMAYNTLYNPKGSKVQSLTLSDGTKVWLNSETTLKYPVAFTGNERKVEITGEAYFEVAKDAKRKFLVSANETTTEVFGTHFNVNSYTDNGFVKVTLLEGSVGVSKERTTVRIVPGEQAEAINNAPITVNHNVDLQEVMAWKEGMFKFKETTIEPLMQQIARWYDVDIIYQGKVNNHFVVTMPRTLSVMNVFKILEETGNVHFTIEGRKVIVKP
ncbi:MAG: FecR domain-containing protein [Bacteroidetes bacterium]|nr:FecR domain-containing protein [Bacteroidota bacterium]